MSKTLPIRLGSARVSAMSSHNLHLFTHSRYTSSIHAFAKAPEIVSMFVLAEEEVVVTGHEATHRLSLDTLHLEYLSLQVGDAVTYWGFGGLAVQTSRATDTREEPGCTWIVTYEPRVGTNLLHGIRVGMSRKG